MSAFSKKHYEAIAKTINETVKAYSYDVADSPERNGIYQTTHSLASLFERDNPAFDRARFIQAAGFIAA